MAGVMVNPLMQALTPRRGASAIVQQANSWTTTVCERKALTAA